MIKRTQQTEKIEVQPVLLNLLALSLLPAISLLLALSSPAALAQQAQSSAQDAQIQQLIDQATNKVLKRFKGKVPANVKSHIVNEINKLNGTGKSASSTAVGKFNAAVKQTSTALGTSSGTAVDSGLLDAIDQILPQRLMDKLPAGIKSELSTANTNKFENMSYWPGLNDPAHQLSLFTPPASSKAFPLIIYVHGGAWLARPNSPPAWVTNFVKSGFAVAVVHYRLEQEGIFPAQMEDLNTALRWLKTNASKFNIDPNRIGLWGASAGGHLVSLMGTSWNNAELDLGPADKSISRQVQAVCDFCGPANLLELGSKMAPGQVWDTVSPSAPLSILLGGPAINQTARAKQASPITYVSASSPPFFIVHGANDQIVPVSQSEELAAALKAAGVPVVLQVVPGAGHDIEKSGNVEAAKQFFINYLKP